MTDPQRKCVNRRTAWLAVVFGLWASVLVFRLVQLQVLRSSRYRTEVIEQSRNKRPLFPRRGTIFDRNGKILARSLPVQSVFLTPPADESAEAQAKKVIILKDILGLTSADLQTIGSRIAKKEHFLYLKRQAPIEVAARAKALGLAGVSSHAENKRFYPMGRLAAHALGGVDIDDRGQAGVEFTYNSTLQGRPGQAFVLRDAFRRKYRLETLQEAKPGKDIVMTLDATIQYIVEKELEKAVQASKASWAAAIVSHPLSGEILALASLPNYDPNSYPPADRRALRNRAIQENFEPGSTFKIVTAAAALENSSVGLMETFDCREQSVSIPGKGIRDYKPFGMLSFSEVFIHSSNIGAIHVGQRTGEAALRRMIQAFGFGRKTGLDLPGEESGIYRTAGRWNRRTLPSVSIGYEISVTAMQILQVMNIVANRGLLVPLRVVRTASASGEDLPPVPQASRRVLSEETANRLTAILERAVEEGTGLAAKVEGYRIAGKTGTSQKYDPEKGTYAYDIHLASFIGFVPADNPVLSAIVVIDEPQGVYYGGQVAAPVFREISRHVLRYERIYPQTLPERGIMTAQALPGGER